MDRDEARLPRRLDGSAGDVDSGAARAPVTRTRAVVFDLWETLALWPAERTRGLFDRLAQRLGDVDWHESYVERMTTPLEAYFRSLGANGALAAELVTFRVAVTREVLTPREGALETLAELRRRGL